MSIPTTAPVPDRPEILRPDEVAKILRVNLRTVYRLLKSCRLKAFRVRRQYRIRRRRELIAFAERNGLAEES